ncbi:hypothetical protein SATRM34S_06781 [Streptomyces atroolivaceus]
MPMPAFGQPPHSAAGNGIVVRWTPIHRCAFGRLPAQPDREWFSFVSTPRTPPRRQIARSPHAGGCLRLPERCHVSLQAGPGVADLARLDVGVGQCDDCFLTGHEPETVLVQHAVPPVQQRARARALRLDLPRLCGTSPLALTLLLLFLAFELSDPAVHASQLPSKICPCRPPLLQPGRLAGPGQGYGPPSAVTVPCSGGVRAEPAPPRCVVSREVWVGTVVLKSSPSFRSRAPSSRCPGGAGGAVCAFEPSAAVPVLLGRPYGHRLGRPREAGGAVSVKGELGVAQVEGAILVGTLEWYVCSICSRELPTALLCRALRFVLFSCDEGGWGAPCPAPARSESPGEAVGRGKAVPGRSRGRGRLFCRGWPAARRSQAGR